MNVVITHVESVDKVIVQLEEANKALLDLRAVTKEAAAGKGPVNPSKFGSTNLF